MLEVDTWIQEPWQDDAACRGAGDLFFPPTRVVDDPADVRDEAGITLLAGGDGDGDGCETCEAARRLNRETTSGIVVCDRHADADLIERAGEASAKRVCLRCPVRTDCLASTLKRAHQPEGVYGGLNRWERQMLQAAGQAQLQEITDIATDLDDEECLELREHFEGTGPDRPWTDAVLANEVAVRHGVPLSLASEWMSGAPAGRKNRCRSEETLAILAYLGDGQWVPRREVQAVAEAAMDPEKVAAKADREGTSEARAREVLFIRALEARRRRGSIEERVLAGEPCMRLRAEQCRYRHTPVRCRPTDRHTTPTPARRNNSSGGGGRRCGGRDAARRRSRRAGAAAGA